MIYFVDVDDTLIRTYGTKVVPIVKTIQTVHDQAIDAWQGVTRCEYWLGR
jgi:hypothetical protein